MCSRGSPACLMRVLDRKKQCGNQNSAKPSHIQLRLSAENRPCAWLATTAVECQWTKSLAR